MKILAIIKNGLVIDTVLINDESNGWEKPDNTSTVDVTGRDVGVGFAYDESSNKFKNPAVDDHLDA
ncbi:hypothetical protein SAMN05216516_10534 [Izhakiella capsodis]|uniref:Uncharacterized protein n=1 Tax=Izhakiella capsodis TaxID=1367852 RepID=A0A1I4XVP1_9GAMM|nr:hypothetical protein [Izhakiella capsodis]SFN29932.1 hypothetical protein SAMN05216516_10534 [Izhakiella capsodis]